MTEPDTITDRGSDRTGPFRSGPDRSGSERVCVANRGEIAIRIADGVRALGMAPIGMYTAADVAALHVQVMDEVRLLPGDAVAGYLDVAAVVAAARDAGCTYLHPGYGFLSERADLARACAAAGIVFVGPAPEALELFGDKVAARRAVAAIGVPVVPGSEAACTDAAEAAAVAARVGYPVMCKAAGGGGGRGLRTVERPDALEEAFARCRSEALAAFGTGDVFVERLVARPRHIEVQIAGDGSGSVVHLHERDCSVQQRNQKVLEIAPAPHLDASVRARLHADALAIARSVRYRGVGTMEFLVQPETGEHWFIECNPRLQVEHTVTEEVTGIDLVVLQLRLAAGAALAHAGVADQDAVGAPRGSAVQARVVLTGGGTITGYKEPTGARVRVDACGYAGYAPPPQFDPLLAKVIGRGDTYTAALDRTAVALAAFQCRGVPTNLGALGAIVAAAEVRAGDARTTLLTERPALLDGMADADRMGGAGGHAADAAGATPVGVVAFLDRSAPAVAAASRTTVAARRDALAVPDGCSAVAPPMASVVGEVRVGVGDAVRAGDVLVVVSAMKMETSLEAPCDATVVALRTGLAPGVAVDAGELLVVLASADVSDARGSDAVPRATSRGTADPGWEPVLAEIRTLQRLAHERLAPGSADPGVVRQRSRGKLTCRERIALLLDDGSFREVGSAAGFATYGPDGAIDAFTPANHVGGSGRVDGRPAIVCADDFTSRGGHADGAIAAKSSHLDRLSIELRVPSVRLLDGSSGGGSVAAMVPEQKRDGESSAQESSGAITAGRPRVAGGGGSFLPGHLGSTMYTEQLATVPVVNVLLGSVVGLGAAKAVLGHFSVMVRDVAQLFVAGPPVVSHAMGVDVTKEELGGWHIHCRNGSVDNLADTEEEAIAQTKRFLSYLPSSVHELPPVLASSRDDAPDRSDDDLLTIVPRKRTTTFDIRRTVALLADRGSFMEIGALWGTDQVVGLCRMDGHPVGVIASDSRHLNGGALTADGCDKVRRHLDLCDLFHVPVLSLVDNPGFAVGIEHEMAGTIRKGGEWMVAFAQVRVPMATVILRRSFGVAGNNWATPRAEPSLRVVWPSADMGGIPPEGGIEAAYKRQLAEAADPAALRAEIEARIESVRGPLGPLSKFQVEEMIDPRDTRALVCDWVRGAYRTGAHADRLGPRPLGFRP